MTDFATLCRYPCGGITALIGMVACGHTCDDWWWCECGVICCPAHDAGPDDVCEHLRDLGAARSKDTR